MTNQATQMKISIIDAIFNLVCLVEASGEIPRNSRKRKDFLPDESTRKLLESILKISSERLILSRVELIERVESNLENAESGDISIYADCVMRTTYMQDQLVFSTKLHKKGDLDESVLDFLENEVPTLEALSLGDSAYDITKYEELKYFYSGKRDIFENLIKRLCQKSPPHTHLGHVIYYVLTQYQNIFINYLMIPNMRKPIVKKTLDFDPEYKKAAVTILSYFQRVLETKYPDTDVAVSIEQDGNQISLLVYSDNKNYEKITESMDEYMDVVRGEKDPSVFFSDEASVVELRNQLNVARVQLENEKNMRELFQGRLRQAEERIEKVEEMNTKLISRLDKLVERKSEQELSAVDLLKNNLSKIGQPDGDLKKLIDLLERDAESGKSVPSSKVMLSLERVAEERQDVKAKIKEVAEGAGHSAISALLYGLIQ